MKILKQRRFRAASEKALQGVGNTLGSSNFFDSFELYKKRYLQQENTYENKKALDLFEKWLKVNSKLVQFRVREKNKKIDLGNLFSGIIDEARVALSGKGIQISSISLGLKESSKCISVFKDKTIYYRLSRTCPRKGSYGGMEMLVIELIMDGNKNNVFVPLLKHIDALESRLGEKIEREGAKVEATGKYRFKLFFPFEYDESAVAVRKFAEVLSNFIYHTRKELIKLDVT